MIRYIRFKIIRLGCFLGLIERKSFSPELIQEGMNEIFLEMYSKWEDDETR